jgi:dolichyl-diphosphooligosaccharide--protein glycosyltransferase
MYFLGKSFNDWKTGLLASVFTAVIGGQYFYRSTFGFVDHHIAEVLFSTLFCLLYIYALRSTTTNKTIIISFFAGIVYLLGYLTMPTMVLFAMIVGIFTVVSFVISRPDKKLVLVNAVVFGTAIIGTLLFGFKTSGYELSSYSIGHPIVYLGLIIFTVFLYILSSNVSTKTLVGILALISLLFVTTSSFLKITFATCLLTFFGQSDITNTVAEAQGWNLIQAAMSFNIGLLLAICGAIVLVLIYVRSHNNSILFVLIWSMIIFLSTWQHVRYEYYIAINIALLSAVFITSIKTKHIGGLLALVFVLLSLYSISTIPVIPDNHDWQESLTWVKSNTPDPGIDYNKIYDKSFVYPNDSYSVMSWWDYGHAITYYAHRIPVSNPFQQGVSGPVGAAAYFMSTNMTTAGEILKYHNSKYVMIDNKMATDDLWAMAEWANASVNYNETMVMRLNRETVPGYVLIHEVGTVKTFEYKGVA